MDFPGGSILLFKVTLNLGCDFSETILETVSELNDHTKNHHATQQFSVSTMNAAKIENIGESTRIDIHKYQCKICVFNSSYMDKLLMQVNTKHRACCR
jgi:hypothetical protein